MAQLSDPPRQDGRRGERDRWSGLLARPTVSSPDFEEHSRRDLARRRLLLDQARHRWLLASRRSGRQPAGRAPGSHSEQGICRDPHSGPLAVREATYAWGLRRVGGHQAPEPHDHPLGAVSICRFHTWRWHLQQHEMFCTTCGLTSHAEF
jgi:hypothetical protein